MKELDILRKFDALLTRELTTVTSHAATPFIIPEAADQFLMAAMRREDSLGEHTADPSRKGGNPLTPYASSRHRVADSFRTGVNPYITEDSLPDMLCEMQSLFAFWKEVRALRAILSSPPPPGTEEHTLINSICASFSRYCDIKSLDKASNTHITLCNEAEADLAIRFATLVEGDEGVTGDFNPTATLWRNYLFTKLPFAQIFQDAKNKYGIELSGHPRENVYIPANKYFNNLITTGILNARGVLRHGEIDQDTKKLRSYDRFPSFEAATEDLFAKAELFLRICAGDLTPLEGLIEETREIADTATLTRKKSFEKASRKANRGPRTPKTPGESSVLDDPFGDDFGGSLGDSFGGLTDSASPETIAHASDANSSQEDLFSSIYRRYSINPANTAIRATQAGIHPTDLSVLDINTADSDPAVATTPSDAPRRSQSSTTAENDASPSRSSIRKVSFSELVTSGSLGSSRTIT